MNQNPIHGRTLAGIAGDRVAVVDVLHPLKIPRNLAARIVEFHRDVILRIEPCDGRKITVGNGGLAPWICELDAVSFRERPMLGQIDLNAA